MTKNQLRRNIMIVWRASGEYHFAGSGYPPTIEEVEQQAIQTRERALERIWKELNKCENVSAASKTSART